MLKLKKIAKNKKRRLIIGVIVVVLLLVGAAGAAYFWYVKNHSGPSTYISNGINYRPPTTEEKQDSQQKKDEIAAQNDHSSPADNTSSIVPVITQWGEYGGNIEVAGYVPSIFEDNGTCTYTFTQGSSSFSKDTKGVQNASNTNCPTISLPPGQFSQKGTWNVTLTYKQLDGKTTKVSEARTINL